ncbi:hypothetical protein IGI37_000683 [Enterococcus sp. AZ194]|uniref:FusB/FusC family EF-G-binding protein n=1 Tax=Enterococcus sp. AZ194 TaxID=2774629 RepID=UPI003F25224D
MPTIQPYQYNFIKNQVSVLLNTYSSVNDKNTVKTVQASTTELVNQLFDEVPEKVTQFMALVADDRLTKAKADQYLETLKNEVIPFNEPSTQQLTKAFRKVKKMKFPKWSELDLRNHSYVGWNDAGTQRKYIVLYEENKLAAVYGTLSPEISKGICSICHKTSEVSMFLSLIKSSGDGTYTKRGNYICHDSEKCNQQIQKLEPLHSFIQTVKAEK